MPPRVTKIMSRDWDSRARKNAFHYIASWREEWDPESFIASGEEDFDGLVVPVLARCDLPTAGKRMLELGCGAGRMTASFAKRFERVYAFDLSHEMLIRARRMHSAQKNILWLRSNGVDLSCVASDSMDFVFSYLVLQQSTFRKRRSLCGTSAKCCACCGPAVYFSFSSTAVLNRR